MDDGAQPFALECRMNLSAILPHYLLRVNATEVILANDRDDQCAPSWVFREFGKTSLVVVWRGAVTRDRIPVGIRGPERSQRWAALCPPSAIRQIITPADLLKRFETTRDSHASRPVVARDRWGSIGGSSRIPAGDRVAVSASNSQQGSGRQYHGAISTS
jgi:phosphoribosyl-dephospho-CoA transferase MdcG